MRAVDGIKHLVIERDDAISRGGAIVETDYGSIDARIERRLEEVEKALKRQIAEKDRVVNREEIEETVKETDGTKATMTDGKAQSSNEC